MRDSTPPSTPPTRNQNAELLQLAAEHLPDSPAAFASALGLHLVAADVGRCGGVVTIDQVVMIDRDATGSRRDALALYGVAFATLRQASASATWRQAYALALALLRAPRTHPHGSH